MPNVDLAKVIELAESDEFWAVRGKAIQSYANLEQSLLALFSVLSGVQREAAAIIMFKITSADARNKIIEKLFRRKFGSQHNLFRNSLIDQMRPIDIERNEVVHWNAACQIGHDGSKETAAMMLIPPAFTSSPDHPRKDTAALRAFDQKCSFYSRLISMFCAWEADKTMPTEAGKIPWADVFAQPIVYPPPSNHLLFPDPQAPESHVQSFLLS